LVRHLDIGFVKLTKKPLQLSRMILYICSCILLIYCCRGAQT